MLHVGMTLLDRQTGKLRYFTEGRQDFLRKLLTQSLDSMAANDFAGSTTDLNSACEIFDEQSHGQPKT